MKHPFLITAFTLALMTWPLYSASVVFAEDGHDHQSEQNHDEEEGHGHDDGDAHNDHGEEADDHDEHGHEEGKTEIAPDAAKKAGVKLSKAQVGIIEKSIVLTGQVILNRDTMANVRARFPGIVRDVPVKLGQAVKKGDVLARLESNESLRDYNITAPVSGVILERHTNVGDVANDETLFVIADLSNVWAKFHIFPKDSPDIQKEQKIYVHTFDHKIESKTSIKLFLPTADSSSQTHVAIVELDNTKGHWRPGLTVDGHVAVSQVQAAIVVPESALQTMEGQTVVFVQHGDSYEMKPVKTGVSDGRTIEILSGLTLGQSYVSEGSFVIKADILKSGAAHEH
jgi:cobalt-zinc-cadmium efflux system membrane fusion protein